MPGRGCAPSSRSDRPDSAETGSRATAHRCPERRTDLAVADGRSHDVGQFGQPASQHPDRRLIEPQALRRQSQELDPRRTPLSHSGALAGGELYLLTAEVGGLPAQMADGENCFSSRTCIQDWTQNRHRE